MKWMIGFLVLLIIACAPGAPSSPAPVIIETEGRIPTPTIPKPPTYTPQPTYTPYPTADIDNMVSVRVAEALAAIRSMTPEPTPTFTPIPATPTPEPTPTRTPTPTPQPVVRPVQAPTSNIEAQALKISSIVMRGRVLQLSGIIEGQGYQPTSMQVWQAYDPEPYSETCSTERPVAFIQPGNGSVVYSGQLTPYSWTFCTQYQKGKPQIDQVPWLYSQSWSYQLRKRIRITDPYIYDFSMTANLDHDRVERLEYNSGVASGWRVIVFSGEKIIAVQWLEY